MFIYAFYHRDRCVYVGSTECSLAVRFKAHRFYAKTNPTPFYTYCREIGGFDWLEPRTLQILDPLTTSTLELREAEKAWMAKLEPDCNVNKATKTRQEHLTEHSQSCKKYYDNNKEAIAERRKTYLANGGNDKAKLARAKRRERDNERRRGQRALQYWLRDFVNL